MDFQAAWQYLEQLQMFKVKLGLDSMRSFLSRLGNPQESLPVVHVGGTNGKGSVSATLQAILSAAGLKVGLFTSPHLSSIRERFRVNDRYISEAAFARHIERIQKVLAGERITYFECTTVLALLWFAEQQVDLAILEVGMGGRLDATNVVKPLVTVITNVAMDHEAYLGDTLERVAFEKAGIIKPGVPLVSGVSNDVSRSVVEEVCGGRRAPCFLLGRDFQVLPCGREGDWSYQGLRSEAGFQRFPCRLRGRHQRLNSGLALAVTELLAERLPLRIDQEVIRRGLERVFWPGRLEYFGLKRLQAGQGGFRWLPGTAKTREAGQRWFLLDGAHNPAGVESLLAALASDFSGRRLVMVWAGMADKDLAGTLRRLAPACATLILTRPESERAASLAQLRAAVPASACQRLLEADSVEQAVEEAWQEAGPEDLIGVAGSLYLVGEVRRLLLGEVVT